jgi:hypothetical protein
MSNAYLILLGASFLAIKYLIFQHKLRLLMKKTDKVLNMLVIWGETWQDKEVREQLLAAIRG